MIAERLKKSILQAAIQGKLTEQLPEDGNAEDLLKEIQTEKEKLIKEGKINKEKSLPKITEDEIPFDIPENWCWVRLGEITVLQNGEQISNRSLPYLEARYLRGKSEGEIKNKGRYVTSDKIIILVDGQNSGELFKTKEEGFLGSTFKILDINRHIDEEFLINLLGFYQDLFRENKRGAAIPHLDLKLFRELIVALPPLTEQKRIVERIEDLLVEVEILKNDEIKLEELQKAFPKKIKDAILQYAIQGKLTKQLPEDGDAKDLLKEIQTEKEKLIKEGKINKEKSLPKITEDEIPFEIPENWCWVRLEDIIYAIGSKKNQIKQNEILKEGTYPVISQSQNIIEGYCNDEAKLLKIPKTVIVFGDHSKTLKLIDFNFIIGADGTKIFVPLVLFSEFLFIALQYNMINLPNGAYSRHYKFLKDRLIPLPPLAEQKRIVKRIEELLPLCEELSALKTI